jgi:hypothetical protein
MLVTFGDGSPSTNQIEITQNTVLGRLMGIRLGEGSPSSATLEVSRNIVQSLDGSGSFSALESGGAGGATVTQTDNLLDSTEPAERAVFAGTPAQATFQVTELTATDDPWVGEVSIPPYVFASIGQYVVIVGDGVPRQIIGVDLDRLTLYGPDFPDEREVATASLVDEPLSLGDEYRLVPGTPGWDADPVEQLGAYGGGGGGGIP